MNINTPDDSQSFSEFGFGQTAPPIPGELPLCSTGAIHVLLRGMKLQQGQTWKRDQYYIRITRLERLAVEYKIIHDLVTKQGAHHKATKKEFCALIKNATLVPANTIPSEEIPSTT